MNSSDPLSIVPRDAMDRIERLLMLVMQRDRFDRRRSRKMKDKFEILKKRTEEYLALKEQSSKQTANSESVGDRQIDTLNRDASGGDSSV